ncbi:MAG: DUF2510 domain-containing protein [Kineosporiaceae bacterium]
MVEYVPAGWYRDGARLRWWNGTAWTAHTKDDGEPGPWDGVSAVPPPRRRRVRLRLLRNA